MTMKEILQTGGGLLLIVLTLVQIAPIKVNPWSAIAAAIGRALNKDVIDLIEKGKAETARYRIIRFNDEIRHDVRHTEEHFTQIIDDIDTYERFCETHKSFPNGKAVHSIANIRKIYDKCCEENTFLV